MEQSNQGPAVSDPVQIKKLVRLHVHDVRNYVNCIGMELAVMDDVVKDPAAHETSASIQKQLHELDGLLRRFLGEFAEFPDETGNG